MLLDVQNLRIEMTTRNGIFPVVDDVSFTLEIGETLGVVGESGCGKTMTALAIMGLLPQDIGRVASGKILFQGQDLVAMSEHGMQNIRGNEISMIFQEPMTSLNPTFSVGDQIVEVLRVHQNLAHKAAHEQAIELLDAVRIPNARARAAAYPFQMSGGQRQRVMIAMALACKPKILIADEPTTALDVTVQAQIFELLDDLRRQTNTAIMLITHDMGVVAQMTARMLVMYAGRKVEQGVTHDLITDPKHPYTQGLVACVPHLLDKIDAHRPELVEIAGIVPSMHEFGTSRCLFAPRCSVVMDKCHAHRPNHTILDDRREVECWRVEQ